MEDFLIKLCLSSQKKAFLKSKAFKYLHYKNVFLDENPKTLFSGKKKLPKAQQILFFFKFVQNKNSWVI